MVTLDENKHGGLAPEFCHKILASPHFRLLVMGIILANAIATATMNFKHDRRPRHVFYENYYYMELGFTALLNLETIFKIWCLGWRGLYNIFVEHQPNIIKYQLQDTGNILSTNLNYFLLLVLVFM